MSYSFATNNSIGRNYAFFQVSFLVIGKWDHPELSHVSFVLNSLETD